MKKNIFILILTICVMSLSIQSTAQSLPKFYPNSVAQEFKKHIRFTGPTRLSFDSTDAEVGSVFLDTVGRKFYIKWGNPFGWQELTGAGGSASWGGITGTLSSQTDLQTALNLRMLKTDTSAMLLPYLRKADTASLSNRINLKADANYNTRGTIYNASSWSGLTDFTNDGTSASIVSNKIQFSSGSNSYTQRLRYNYNTGLERWQQTVKILVGEKSATSYGFALGVQSINSFGGAYSISTFAKFDMTSGTSAGRMYLYNYQNGSATLMDSTTTGLSFAAGDTVIFTVQRELNDFVISAFNKSFNSASIFLRYSYTGANQPHNTGNFAIYPLGGTFTVHAWNIFSAQPKGANLMFVGDSKMGSYLLSDYQQRAVAKVNNAFCSAIANSGNGDGTAEILKLLPEIAALRPKTVFLYIGSNDVRTGVSSATYQANIDSIKNYLTIQGIAVKAGIFYETAISQATLLSHLKSSFGANYIETHDAIKDGGSGLLSDNTHLTSLGHDKVFEAIVKSGQIVSDYSLLTKSEAAPNGISKYYKTDGVALGYPVQFGTNDDFDVWFKRYGKRLMEFRKYDASNNYVFLPNQSIPDNGAVGQLSGTNIYSTSYFGTTALNISVGNTTTSNSNFLRFANFNVWGTNDFIQYGIPWTYTRTGAYYGILATNFAGLNLGTLNSDGQGNTPVSIYSGLSNLVARFGADSSRIIYPHLHPVSLGDTATWKITLRNRVTGSLVDVPWGVVQTLVGGGGGSMVYPGAGIPVSTGSAWGSSITNNSTNWNTAYTERNQWDGGATGLTASTGRTSLGATTVGSNLFTLSNPSAVRYIQINSDNTVTLLDASGLRTAISALSVSGSPTNGTMARWLSSSLLGTSLFYDNGSSGGFNTTSLPSGIKFQFNGTDGSLQIFRLTSTQRDAISSPSDYGMHWNTTLNKLEVRRSGAWEQYSTDQELGTLGYNKNYDSLIRVLSGNNVEIKSIRVIAGANITINRVVTDSTISYEVVGAGSSGANAALSNLASVAINTALLPGTTNSIALGSLSFNWSDLYLGNGAVIDFNNDVQLIHGSNNLSITGGNLTTDLAVESTVGGTGLVVGTSNTQTLSNKRWVPRVGSTTSSATPTINTDNVDIYKLTAQAADITSFTTNLSGTPNDGDILEIQITGTAARAITWGSSFVSSTVTLPTTTVTTATLTVVFQYYTTSSYGNNKWVCVNSY